MVGIIELLAKIGLGYRGMVLFWCVALAVAAGTLPTVLARKGWRLLFHAAALLMLVCMLVISSRDVPDAELCAAARLLGPAGIAALEQEVVLDYGVLLRLASEYRVDRAEAERLGRMSAVRERIGRCVESARPPQQGAAAKTAQ